MADIDHVEELDHDESEVFPDESDGNFTLDSEGNSSLALHDESNIEDPELEAIKARVREMEEEAEKLKEMQSEVEKQMNMSSPTLNSSGASNSDDTDSKSIYVGNVDYGSTAEELEQHFHGCGSVNRVTILCDKYSGHPKGFAYIEFADKDSVQMAQALDESLFRGRQIKVNPKRTNMPGISSTNRGWRGRGAGGGRRSFRTPVSSYPRSRGRGRGYSFRFRS